MAVAVAQHGKIIWEEAFGWADLAEQRAATIHTPYLMASVTKPMTATAVMMLAERGKIDLDKPINEYLPKASQIKVWIGEPQHVTIRRVLSHTSGLPSHAHSFDVVTDCPAMEESIRRYGNIIAPAGERYGYSNIGYGILEFLVEQISGMSYADFLRSEIFLPLNMTHSAIGLIPEIKASAATLYDDENQPIAIYDTDHRGATMAYCSAHDLLLFGLFHLRHIQLGQKPILSEASLSAMQQRLVMMNHGNTADLNLRPDSGYGLGWVVDDDELDLRISHGGGFHGCSTKLLMIPSEGIVIATMINQFCGFAYTIENEILSALIPGYAQRLLDTREKWAQLPPPPTAYAQPTAELLGTWRGLVHTCERTLPLVLVVKPSGDIHVKLGEQLWTLLNDAKFSNGRLTGKTAGTMQTRDTTRRPVHPMHHLQLDLTLRENTLKGAVISVAVDRLSHWVELIYQQE